MNMAQKGLCRLCGTNTSLEYSHIIPSFVFKWFKQSSVTGFMRFSYTPNQRAQDGFRCYLLCRKCEGLFSGWEKSFSEQIFAPLNEGKADKLNYGRWLLKFSVSLSWRVLTFYKDYEYQLEHLSKELLSSIETSLRIWREFLLDERPHPDKYEQHILLLDLIHDYEGRDIPPNINRYILRSIDSDVAHSNREAFVYSKIGRVLLVGFVKIDTPHEWIGTKVHVKHGNLFCQRYKLPAYFRDYLFGRAKTTAKLASKLSSRQKKRIEIDYNNNLGGFESSETFKATSQDFYLLGNKAFQREKESK